MAAKYTVRLADGNTCGHLHRTWKAADKCLRTHLPTIASVALVGAPPPPSNTASATPVFGSGFRLNPPGVLDEIPQKKGRTK